MTILRQFPENLSNETKYDLLRSPKTQKMSDVKGQRLEVAAYMIREETTESGEVTTICSIKTRDGDLFATNSKTFMREFDAIVECSGGSEFAIDVLDGVSRAGRHYLTCAWAH